MKLGNFRKSFDEMQKQTRLAQGGLVGFFVLSVILLFIVLTRDTLVTVVLFTLQDKAEIFEDDATQNYKEAWAMAIAILVGNVQPSNVEFIGERIKPLLAPEIYHSTIDAMHANAQQLRDERVSMRFEPRQVIYEKSTKKLFVYGYSYVRLGSSLESEHRSDRTYEMTLDIREYAPLLTYITTYSGSPLTRDVIETAEKKKEMEINRKRRQAERQGLRYVPESEQTKEGN